MGRQRPRGVWGDVWGHRVGLTSLLIIQEAYMPIYKGSRLSLRAGQSEALQEVLADLKTARTFCSILMIDCWTLVKNKN